MKKLTGPKSKDINWSTPTISYTRMCFLISAAALIRVRRLFERIRYISQAKRLTLPMSSTHHTHAQTTRNSFRKDGSNKLATTDKSNGYGKFSADATQEYPRKEEQNS
jgi:hypothetical protein